MCAHLSARQFVAPQHQQPTRKTHARARERQRRRHRRHFSPSPTILPGLPPTRCFRRRWATPSKAHRSRAVGTTLQQSYSRRIGRWGGERGRTAGVHKHPATPAHISDVLHSNSSSSMSSVVSASGKVCVCVRIFICFWSVACPSEKLQTESGHLSPLPLGKSHFPPNPLPSAR